LCEERGEEREGQQRDGPYRTASRLSATISEVAKERAMARRECSGERGRTPAKERVHSASYVAFRSERCQ
jgi:hypothetical protein